MKIKILILLILVCSSFSAWSQVTTKSTSSTVDPKNSKEGRKDLYLYLEGTELKGWHVIEDSPHEISDGHTYMYKGEQKDCSIYLKWLNPLKYQVSWRDSSIVDPDFQTANEFIDLIEPLFIASSPIKFPDAKASSKLKRVLNAKGGNQPNI